MAPPCYTDLGKQARDLLSKGYNFGSWKVEAKSTTEAGVKFKTNGTHVVDSGKSLGEFETEFSFKDYGLSFVENWNTENSLCCDISIEDQLIEGSKFTFSSTVNPTTGQKSSAIKSSYKTDSLNASLDSNFNFTGSVINGSLVFGYLGWMSGCQTAFDTSKKRLMNTNFNVGYTTSDSTLNAHCNNMQEYGASYWQKASERTEIGAQLDWNQTNGQTGLSLGGKYDMSADTVLRARVNNQTQVGLSVQQTVCDGISATLSTLIDAKNFNAGGHRVGLSLNLEQ